MRKFSPKIKTYTLTLLFSLFLVAPSLVVAQQGLVPCGGEDCTVQKLFDMVVIVTNFLIAFAGLIAVGMIVYSGLKLVVSAGNPSAYAAAKKGLGNAIIGLVLTFAAYFIANLVATQLGIDGGDSIFSNPTQFIKGK